MMDLSDVPVIDTHLHGWRTSELLDGRARELRRTGHDAGHVRADVRRRSGGLLATCCAQATASTPLALAMLARLGAQLGCEPTNEAVSAARLERLHADATGYLQELWRHARIEGLVVDEGFPLPIIPGADFATRSGHSRCTASCASSRGSPRSARAQPAMTNWRMRSVRASRRRPGGRRRGLQVGDRVPDRPRHRSPERRRCARGLHALAPGRLSRDAGARQARA